MTSSLRALSLVFASAALALGPGQAIAGNWGADSGRYDDDWGKGSDWDKDDDWDGDDIRNLRVCFDDDTNELRVKFEYRDNGWYDKHKGDYDIDRRVDLTILEGEAVCEKRPGRGHGRGVGLRQVETLDGLCLDERACHTNGCFYEARFDLDRVRICRGNRDLCSVDIDRVRVTVDGDEECEVRVSDCDSGW
jgi:hypothetical protein